MWLNGGLRLDCGALFRATVAFYSPFCILAGSPGGVVTAVGWGLAACVEVLRFSCLFGTVLGVGSIKARRCRRLSGVWRELLGAVLWWRV